MTEAANAERPIPLYSQVCELAQGLGTTPERLEASIRKHRPDFSLKAARQIEVERGKAVWAERQKRRPRPKKASLRTPAHAPRGHLELPRSHELRTHAHIVLEQLRALYAREPRWYRMGEVEQAYKDACAAASLKPRKHTMVWMYVQRLRVDGLIEAEVTYGAGAHAQGTSTLLRPVP